MGFEIEFDEETFSAYRVTENESVMFQGSPEKCLGEIMRLRALPAETEAKYALIGPDDRAFDEADWLELARQAKKFQNWTVEIMNGAVKTVMFRGMPNEAAKIYERRSKDPGWGGTIMLRNPEGLPISQCARPHFRTVGYYDGDKAPNDDYKQMLAGAAPAPPPAKPAEPPAPVTPRDESDMWTRLPEVAPAVSLGWRKDMAAIDREIADLELRLELLRLQRCAIMGAHAILVAQGVRT